MKAALNLFVIIVFLLFAYWQLNDPDPVRWISIYLGVVVSVGLLMARKYFAILPLIGSIICLAGLFYLSPDFISWIKEGMPTITGQMKAESPHIELVREFLGFLIAGSAYFAYYRLHRKAS
ncbi:MAG: transmembrane 220 family protein [Saprospiraceae bacterium]|nr:transmembrane 220 family protein [Saprospiraceae bacterium]